MRYYLIAGEASGDLHGSLLMQKLAGRDPQAQFRFFGGDKMAAAGGAKAFDYRDTAVMGVVEVLSHTGRLRRRMAACKADILSYAPDSLILIDYPGFNLRMARFAHKHGIKVIYYIAPKVWASRERRVEQLRKYVDRLVVIFPFEVEWFRKRGIEPVYEGNPLLGHIDSVLAKAPSREEFLMKNGLDSKPLIALLPGSRVQEIKYLAPKFRKAAADSRLAGFQFAVAAAPGIDPEVYERFFPGIPVVHNQTYELLKHSAAAAVASGTASLEAVIIGTPQVVCYGTNPLTYLIARAIMKVKYVSLVNLTLGRPAVKELLQDACTPEAISAELLHLTADTTCRSAIEAEYACVRHSLCPARSA